MAQLFVTDIGIRYISKHSFLINQLKFHILSEMK